MKEENIKTEYLKERIQCCEEDEVFKAEIVPLLMEQKENWGSKIREIIETSGYSKTKFAELSGVSRVSVDKWCKGALPKNRETFLLIGLAAGYDRTKMDHFLQRYGRYPALYAKSLEDCICIFILNKYSGEDAVKNYHYILNKIKDNIFRTDAGDSEDLSTVVFDAKLSDIQDEDELERFVTENTEIFSTAYHRLFAQIKAEIIANLDENVSGTSTIFGLADAQGWSSSLRQTVSAINQRKWYPTRNKIISLGIFLSMGTDEIDDLLKLAHMEGLCAKNIFESIIIYIIEKAGCETEEFNKESENYDMDWLFGRTIEFMQEFDFPEVQSFIMELVKKD